MSEPTNPNPLPSRDPQAPAQTTPDGTSIIGKVNTPQKSAATQQAVRIPTAHPQPPPLPTVNTPQKEAQAVAGGTEIRSEPGKPLLRAPDIKLKESITPAAAAKPPPLRAPRSQGSMWGVRLGLAAGLAISLGLLYWSVFIRLSPVTTEHRQRAIEMTRASDELEMLRRRWAPNEVEELKARHARAQKSLFNAKQDLVDWETQMRDQARAKAWDADVKMGAPQPTNAPVPGITVATAAVNLQPLVMGSTNLSAYARLLRVTEALADSPKRLDLIELSVTGDSNSVSQAQAVVQLYAEGPKP